MKLDKLLKLMMYLDQSPLVWALVFCGLIFFSFYIEDQNKLTADLSLILAGAISPRIRSKKEPTK